MFPRAKHYLDLGYCPIPLRENSKTPAEAWAEFQKRKPTPREVEDWWRYPRGTAIVCGAISGGLFVRDFDSKEKARAFYRANKNIIRTIVESRKGFHFYFRAKGRNFQGDREDGRGEGGYVVAPPTVIDGFEYRFVDGFDLVRPEELCEIEVERPVQRVQQMTDEIRNLESWLMKIESFQGKCGNSGLVRFVTKCRNHNLSQARCMELLLRWNQQPDRVSPPWSGDELVRAVENLYGEKNAANQRIQ